MATALRQQAVSGQITWKEAATQAQETRNATMDIMRSRSTPIGRSMAERMKLKGKTFNGLIAKKTLELFGHSPNFRHLSSSQQNTVYAEIVRSAGSSRPEVTTRMRRLMPAARGLIILSIALSVYEVLNADNKLSVAKRELVTTGAGIGGGIAGGALAGLACGPAAPICVTAGAFTGGALAAFGVNFFW